MRLEVQPGDLVTVDWDGDGTWRVAKILVTEVQGVHVRVYAERFEERPPTRPDTLTLGTIHDESYGVGHLPLSWEEFELWRTEPLSREPVTEDDLEGFRVWQEAAQEGGAGFFRPPKWRWLLHRLRRR